MNRHVTRATTPSAPGARVSSIYSGVAKRQCILLPICHQKNEQETSMTSPFRSFRNKEDLSMEMIPTKAPMIIEAYVGTKAHPAMMLMTPARVLFIASGR